VGDFLHWGLLGTLSIQLCKPVDFNIMHMCSVPSDLYYLAFPKDRLSTKCLVYGVYALELVETILVTHDAFAAFGYGYGDLSALTNVGFAWLSIPVMSGLGNLGAK
jgi:hypothetical protein